MFDIFRKKTAAVPQLFFHTDIHCHLVPGIDDGQREAAGGADLVARQHAWGIDRIICTPHMTQDVFENTPRIIVEAFSLLQAEVESRGIDVRLEWAAEHRMDPFFLEQFEKGNVCPYPNDFILVENSFIQEAWNLDQTLFDISVKGLRPVLAHPERYGYWFDKPARYAQLHQAGTLFQVNLLSLAGYYGKPEKKMAEYLIDNDMVDFLGTDMHNPRHADAIEEYLKSKDYRRHAQKLEGRILNDTVFLRK